MRRDGRNAGSWVKEWNARLDEEGTTMGASLTKSDTRAPARPQSTERRHRDYRFCCCYTIAVPHVIILP
jgi:hypothetical protein